MVVQNDYIIRSRMAELTCSTGAKSRAHHPVFFLVFRHIWRNYCCYYDLLWFG